MLEGGTIMGYYIKMTESKFTIKKENFENALKSLKAVFVPENMRYYDRRIGSDEKCPHFSWVDTKTVLDSMSIVEALENILYVPQLDQNGDICNVEFIGQKYGDEDIFFKALAPYVETGSYLCFIGEDGDTLKWIFNDGSVTRLIIRNY